MSLYRDDVWAGDGTLRAIGTKAVAIDDCPADLGDDVYEALEREIQDGMARGFGAEVDPSC